MEGPRFAGLPARCVPPSGFGYPPGGLRPSVPRRFYFAPAALMGLTLRSFHLSRGMRAFPLECTHLPFRGHDTGRKRRADMATGFLGFNPLAEFLAVHVCLIHQPLEAPLGFLPFRALNGKP